MKKNMYRLLQLRILRATMSRFLSILLIIFIGTAFFAGLRITPLVMNTSTSTYMKNQNFADLTYISSYGITAEEIDKISLIDGVQSVQGGYHFDALSIKDKHQEGVTVYSYHGDDSINKPYLSEGRLPKDNSECLVDERYVENHSDIKIGGKITLQTPDTKKEYTIVGTSRDVRYLLYYDRGSNTYGDGSTAAFVHLPEEAAKELSYNSQLHELIGDTPIYQEVLITIDKDSVSSLFSDAYQEVLDAIKIDIEETIYPIVNARFDKIIDDKYALLAEPIKQYEDGLAEYNNGVESFETEKNNTELTLLENRLLLLEQKQLLNSAQTDFTAGASTILDEIVNIESQIQEIQNDISSLNPPTIPEEGGEEVSPPATEEIVAGAQTSLQELQTSLDQVELFIQTSMLLENSQLSLEKAELELDIGEATFQQVVKETEETLEETKNNLDLANQEIENAKDQIESIPKTINVILDYNLNQGLASFTSDSDRIDALARVFPSIFFLVAALVSLTTMTRMVEEQRNQNGTLRALGYTKKDIITQYLIYALLATVIGSILGIALGIYIFPMIIYGLYSTMMYDVPQKMVLCLDISLFLQTGGIAIITILIATLASCIKELNVFPATLMRAKAPMVGKRIVLERITFLWKRLSFNQKVTFRNIFRYKKRFLMSIIGIAGCTALLITGFGIKYSITDMASHQFDDIQIYDVSMSFKESIIEENADTTITTLKKDNTLIKEQLLAYQTTITAKKDGESIDSSFIIPRSLHRMSQYFHLFDYKSNEDLLIDDEGIIISEKAAEVLGVKANDSIRITLNEKEYDVTISAICQNYLQHYIYMSPTLYASLTGETVSYNANYINMTKVNDTNKQTLGSQLMDNENITSIVFNSTIAENFATQMNSIDLVVWVLIASAGLLAFIVLYNLTNINIKERTNEIATIKVLGFYPKEVYDYIFRENKVLTIIGALVGCALGGILHQFILQTVEMDFIMFVRSIRPISFVYAFVLTYVFTIIINFIMRSILKRIDMIASLKQVE
ncbi:MAG: ABC transporter permease [Coprobacillaceae bacterium]